MSAERTTGALDLTPASEPTFYFIGVSTSQSIIMRVFPAWVRHLGLGRCRITGIDLKLHDDPARYREVVGFIKNDPLSMGGLVTTHKIDLLHACRAMFDKLDDYASWMGEVSAISKSGGLLIGAAKDAVTSGLALEAFLPQRHWEKTKADALIMGAGGSSIALSSYLGRRDQGSNRPARIFVTNRSMPRLDKLREIHRAQSIDALIEYVLTPRSSDNDAVLGCLSPGSLVANATGLGKDAPGSPLGEDAVFPEGGLAWDFNYRGDLLFLRQASCQASARGLHVEDGWLYFIYGWLAVMAEVFHRKIPTRGPEFDELCRIAERERMLQQ